MNLGRATNGHTPPRTGQPRHHRVPALALGAALVLTACTSAADAFPEARRQAQLPFSAEVTARLEAVLIEAKTLAGATGALAGVWAPWAGSWVAAPGSASATSPGPLIPEMSFRIGTNTTALTCTVLLRLVEEGEVRLDDPVSTYLPRMVGLEGITLGQLCRNTSGLADHTPLLAPQFVSNPTRRWSTKELVASGTGAPRVALPGGIWSPSDTGIVLLGLALQQATGRDWPWLYRHYVFEPLGMTATSLPSADEVTLPGESPRGYAAALDPAGEARCGSMIDVTELSPSTGGVAAGAVSDLADLTVWAQALAAGTLLTDQATDAQWAPVPSGGAAPGWQQHGLGAERFGPLVGQSGAIPGFISAAMADPDSGLTVVVVFNNSTSGRGFAEAVARRLAAVAASAPARGDGPAPRLDLPWSEEQAAEAIRAAAVCPPPDRAE
ncbi:serine hydrolase domain-containing protein [Cryobacterium cryoconiti]|uniref:Class A beta-lactamase-related serine hydrolase n=1 Tax=Cryobacterium cryoconiti TaxID=1259239 RepID=A0A4Y8JU61_9MICO|nr:serine hydrolase domain-containing protein [Cryobacterium cryoconiti]TFD29616.1 class A beta-lactamase-related serine hydrolase [Cryobacterium cryoconiti]